jgi:regulator of replication initiation timing
MYVKKLEVSIKNLNEKLDSLKIQFQKLKDENSALKASNDNHIYISDRLS